MSGWRHAAQLRNPYYVRSAGAYRESDTQSRRLGTGMGTWANPCSVVILSNASIYRIASLCRILSHLSHRKHRCAAKFQNTAAVRPGTRSTVPNTNSDPFLKDLKNLTSDPQSPLTAPSYSWSPYSITHPHQVSAILKILTFDPSVPFNDTTIFVIPMVHYPFPPSLRSIGWFLHFNASRARVACVTPKISTPFDSF